jgi:hypothetical protein
MTPLALDRLRGRRIIRAWLEKETTTSSIILDWNWLAAGGLCISCGWKYRLCGEFALSYGSVPQEPDPTKLTPPAAYSRVLDPAPLSLSDKTRMVPIPLPSPHSSGVSGQ